MKLPIFGLFSNWEREFHPEIFPYFWNSKIPSYSRTAGIWIGGSFIPLGETVCIQGAESISRRVTTLKLPRGYQIPKIWTISEPRGCETQGVSFLYLKLPLLSSLSQFEGVSSRPPPRLHDFWNSRNLDYSRTAGILIGGSFIFLHETVCTQGAKTIWRRATNLRDSRGYWIPKFWTILESREFEFGGVSLLSKISYYFWNSRNRSYFRTAGISKWGGFILIQK